MKKIVIDILLNLLLVYITWTAWKEQKSKIIYTWKDQKKRLFKNALFWILILIPITIATAFLKQKFLGNSSTENQKLISSSFAGASMRGKILWFFFAIVWAPIWEEVVFRWLIFKIFGKKKLIAFFISLITFALAHYKGDSSLLHMVSYLPGGAVLAYNYWKNDSNILYPISIHFLNNLFSFSIITFQLILKK